MITKTISLFYAADPSGGSIAGTNCEHRFHAVQKLGSYILPHGWKASEYELDKVGEVAIKNGYSVQEIQVEIPSR